MSMALEDSERQVVYLNEEIDSLLLTVEGCGKQLKQAIVDVNVAHQSFVSLSSRYDRLKAAISNAESILRDSK